MENIFNIIYLILGAAIGILSSFAIDYWKEAGKNKKAKNGILAEIKMNISYVSNHEYRHIQWRIYELFLEYLSAFKIEQIERLVIFYAKLKRHKDLGDDYRLKQNKDRNYQNTIDGETKRSAIENDIKEIETIGREIIKSEGLSI